MRTAVKRVKQLFERARSNAPVLFLDELDMTDEIVGQLLQ
jgi:ATP-dependent Zn protease